MIALMGMRQFFSYFGFQKPSGKRTMCNSVYLMMFSKVLKFRGRHSAEGHPRSHRTTTRTKTRQRNVTREIHMVQTTVPHHILQAKRRIVRHHGCRRGTHRRLPSLHPDSSIQDPSFLLEITEEPDSDGRSTPAAIVFFTGTADATVKMNVPSEENKGVAVTARFHIMFEMPE